MNSRPSDRPPLAGILEAGGTKFLVSAGTGPDDLSDIVRIPTTTPAETLAEVVRAFRAIEAARGPLDAIGVGTFGPAGVHPGTADYGWITATPKPGWSDTDVRGALAREFGVPVAFDTDVNAAAVGESLHGAGRGCDAVLYLTVGTGIGGGFVVRGSPLHGLLHPEMGHIPLPRQPGDTARSVCPWHDDCLEGLASGTALAARWPDPPESLPPDHEAWPLEAAYLARACATFLFTLSPQRIVLGGGVMDRRHLFPLVRRQTAALLNGYLRHPEIENGLASLVVPPALPGKSALVGALALARAALAKDRELSGLRSPESCED